jgi:hypothetical protein
MEVCYSFNRIWHNVSRNKHFPLLANSIDAINRLRLRHRIPMRLDDVNVVCGCEVESKERISIRCSVVDIKRAYPSPALPIVASMTAQ